MKINRHLRLILHDVQSYDIPSCHYNILKHLGYDLSGIDENNKIERNIAIGKMMRDNSNITKLLRETTASIIDQFILQNNIQDEEIVIRQYDGLLLTKGVKKLDVNNFVLEHRNNFDVFIASIKRNKYIAYDSVRNQEKIKGVAFRYEKIDDTYRKICRLNYAKKAAIFRGLHNIKNQFMTIDDPKLFAIPTKNDRFVVYLKGYGEMEITRPTIKIMDTNDIDRQRYFDFYITPFTKSIILEYVR